MFYYVSGLILSRKKKCCGVAPEDPPPSTVPCRVSKTVPWGNYCQPGILVGAQPAALY